MAECRDQKAIGVLMRQGHRKKYLCIKCLRGDKNELKERLCESAELKYSVCAMLAPLWSMALPCGSV